MAKSEKSRGRLICRVYRGVPNYVLYVGIAFLALLSLGLCIVAVSMLLSPLASERTGGMASGAISGLLGLLALYFFMSTPSSGSHVVKFYEEGVEYSATDGAEPRFTRYSKLQVISIGLVDKPEPLYKPPAVMIADMLFPSRRKVPAVELQRNGEPNIELFLPSIHIMEQIEDASS